MSGRSMIPITEIMPPVSSCKPSRDTGSQGFGAGGGCCRSRKYGKGSRTRTPASRCATGVRCRCRRAHHVARVDIDDGEQVHEAATHRDVAYVELPHMVDVVYGETSEQVRVFAGLRVGASCPRLRAERPPAHHAHQPPQPVRAHVMAFDLFFRNSTSIVSSPIVLYSCSMSLSLSSLPLASALKASALRSLSRFFHWLTWFGLSWYLLHSSGSVWFSCIASKATFALNSAVYLRRLTFFVSFIFPEFCAKIITLGSGLNFW